MPVIANINSTVIGNHRPAIQARIMGSIESPQLDEVKTLFFLIDSGAVYTTIMPFDVHTLGIDWENLPLADFNCKGASGESFRPRLLKNVKIHLNEEKITGTIDKSIELPSINIEEVPDKLTYDPDPFSILGMDVLSMFQIWRWQFRSGKLFLLE